jgi:hypothetical protein
MLAWTIASYIKKNTNSKISVQGSILAGTNGMTALRNIPTIIWGKDENGRTPLLQIKTVKGLKREKFRPLWCGTYLSLTVWSVCSLILGKLNSFFGMSNERGMERSVILLMVCSGKNLTIAVKTFLAIHWILDLVLAPMEWILLERWGTHTVSSQLLCAYTIILHGCCNISGVAVASTVALQCLLQWKPSSEGFQIQIWTLFGYFLFSPIFHL